MKVRCNSCESLFHDEYIKVDEKTDEECCPVCGENGYLMDLDNEGERQTNGDKLREFFGDHITDDMIIDHTRAYCNKCILKKFCVAKSAKNDTCRDVWKKFLNKR